MNHKRGRPKNRRAGCLMCKSHKANGFDDRKTVGCRGFGAHVKREIHADVDLKEADQKLGN